MMNVWRALNNVTKMYHTEEVRDKTFLFSIPLYRKADKKKHLDFDTT